MPASNISCIAMGTTENNLLATFSNYGAARLVDALARVTGVIASKNNTRGHELARPIYMGFGACYVLTRRFFETFDQLWAPSFLMGEEYFLTRQLHEQGLGVYYDPSLCIQHRFNGAMENVPRFKSWEFGRNAHRLRRSIEKGHGPRPDTRAPAVVRVPTAG